MKKDDAGSGSGAGGPLRLYLSASLANGPLNLRLREALPPPRFELILPQEFSPVGVDHPRFPAAVYERCVREMERCDAGLLLLDAFGMDSAAESGWFAARRKPLVGLAAANLRFLRHWMVKGNLTAVVCLDPAIREAVEKDPILARIPVRSCPSLAGLAEVLPSLAGAGGTA